jgi:PAS domain S-box-containing protein
VQGLAELFFTLYADVTDVFNLLGHVYKAIAYVMIYRALFVAGVRTPYRELVREQGYLQTLLETIPDLVWLKDPNGVICPATRPSSASSGPAGGYRRQDRLRLRAARNGRLFPPQRPDRHREGRADRERGIAHLCRRRLSWHLRDDQDTHARPQGRIIGVLGISHDITARKALELELRDKDAQFRLAIESSPDGFWVTNLEGRIVTVNDAYCRISGYTRAELLGQHIYDIDAKYDSTVVLAQLTRLQATGFHRFETVHRAHDGHLWPVEVLASFDPSGGGRIFAFFRDITERKQAEAELSDRQARLEAMVAERTAALSAMMAQVSASEERYKFALEATQDGIWDWDLRTDKVQLNTAYGSMLGYGPGELSEYDGSQWQSFLHPDERARIGNLMREMLATGVATTKSNSACVAGTEATVGPQPRQGGRA